MRPRRSATLCKTARTTPALAGNPAAERGEVIKAILLAGATHRVDWTNNPVLAGPDRGIATQPLDDIYGADTLNVDTSHLILTGGEHDGALTPPSSANASHATNRLPPLRGAPAGGTLRLGARVARFAGRR